MNEMEIDSIRVSLLNYQRVVILKQKDGDRYLPIWIGPSEAEAIAVKLQDVTVARPLTHDLLNNIISELGGQIERITVSGLDHDTFYAKISVSIGDRLLEIDSRTSDALALAVRAGVPIFAADDVVERAGVELDEESGGAVVGGELDTGRLSGTTPERQAPMGPEELQKLSAFEDFIESLDMGDLGDEKSGSGDKE